MDPLKSLVKKKWLLTRSLKYDLLNQAAAETNLYSEEQGIELEELAQDNPVTAVDMLLELIRDQSTYEAFIQTLERSIEIGHSQQGTVVDAQAHEQLVKELVGGKKPKGLKSIKVPNPFKSKEKKSRESESKKHFSVKDKKIVPQKARKNAPRQKREFQEFTDSEFEIMDQDDALMDASDLIHSTHSGHHPILEETASAIYDPRGICRKLPGNIQGEQMRQDSHYNYGGRRVPAHSQSCYDFSQLLGIYEQGPRDRVSSASKSDNKQRSLPRNQSFRKNQGSHRGVSYEAHNQSVSFNKESAAINVNNTIDAGSRLPRTASSTSVDFAMGETSVKIETVQRDIEFLKLKIESLNEKVSQVKVVATNVEHIGKDQDVSRSKIESMGERLTVLEASGNKEEIVKKEDLTVLRTKYQELERENKEIKKREVKLQAKVQSYEKRQQELQEELTTLRNNEVKSLGAHTEEQIKLSRALQGKMDAYAKEQARLRDLIAGLQDKLKGSHLEPHLQAKHEKAVADIKLEQVNLDARVQEQKVNLENTQNNVKELHDKMQASDAKYQNSWEEIKELKRTNALLRSDVEVAQNTLVQYDSSLEGMKEEMGQISRQSATMQAEMSRRDISVSQEKRLPTDEQKREIDDLEKRLEKQIAQSQEQIEQMRKKQMTMDGELQENIRSIGQIHLKLRSNEDGPPEWDKLNKKLEDAGREMGKISEITEKLKCMEEQNKAAIQDVNELSRRVEEQKDEVEKLIQKDHSKKTAKDDQATTDHTFSASLENLKQQVAHMQTSWEERFGEFELKVHIDAERKESMDEEVEKLKAMINERLQALKKKWAL